MPNAGQTVTYMRLRRRAQNLPVKIKVSTIYGPAGKGEWETLVFRQRRRRSISGNDWCYRIIDEYHTNSEPAEQHKRAVELYRRLGYRVTGQRADSISEGLEEIGILELAGSTKKQWDQWGFMKYLKEKDGI